MFSKQLGINNNLWRVFVFPFRCSGEQIPFLLHSFALLLNCTSLKEAEAVVLHLYTVTKSPTVSAIASDSYQWLKDAMPKIGCKDFGTCLEQCEGEHGVAQENNLEEDDDNLLFNKEQEFLNQTPGSPFKIHFDNLLLSREIIVDKACEDSKETKENRFFMPAAMDYIQQYRLPNLPLWSGIMKG